MTAQRGDSARGHFERDELAEAWAALPESVSGDAAPEGTSLADRIRAIVMERDEARNGWKRCHERHMALERADHGITS